MTRQTLADGRIIEYDYDANGNLTALQPPGRPDHVFTHTPVNLTADYQPPELADSTGNTSYTYNLDRRLIRTTLSDSSLIRIVYDSTGCNCGGGTKPARIITDRGETVFDYFTNTGKLRQITTPASDVLQFTYDGSLPKSVAWSGSVNGNVAVTYNNDFRVVTQSVNGGNAVSYVYDNDGLLTHAGGLSISHDPANGMMTGTVMGNVTTGYTFTDLGELSNYTAQYNGSELFATNYTLDNIGRITQIDESVLGDLNVFRYTYDLSGRLEQVFRNDTLISTYSYDSNGNRLSHAALSDTLFGMYDDQDRMLAYGNANYGYTANGSLTIKISGTDTTHYQVDLLGNLIA